MTELEAFLIHSLADIIAAEFVGVPNARRDAKRAAVRIVARMNALAAGSGTAETRGTAAQCEASQSGGEAVTPKPQGDHP